jgi:hypothetical protein
MGIYRIKIHKLLNLSSKMIMALVFSMAATLVVPSSMANAAPPQSSVSLYGTAKQMTIQN